MISGLYVFSRCDLSSCCLSRLLGESHDDVLIIKHNLAELYLATGKQDEYVDGCSMLCMCLYLLSRATKLQEEIVEAAGGVIEIDETKPE